MPHLGDFIDTFANAWDAADAAEDNKPNVMSCCSRSPVFLGTVWTSSEFLNSAKGFVFQYMPDVGENSPIKGHVLKILCNSIYTIP